MSEKVFTKKMTLSICLILLCLCALSISAGAFFSDTAKSNTKTFSTATFDLTITPTEITDGTTTPVTLAPDSVEPQANAYNTYQLAQNTDYNIVISIKNGITATTSGYCKIEVYSGTNTTPVAYYTKQIAVANSTDGKITTTRSFTLKTSSEDVTVKFIPLWGTYSGDNPLEDNVTVTLTANSGTGGGTDEGD